MSGRFAISYGVRRNENSRPDGSALNLVFDVALHQKESIMNYEKGQLYQIPLQDLQADPNQPRKFMDPQALEDLAASIRAHGVLTPILFAWCPRPRDLRPKRHQPISSWPVSGASRRPKMRGLRKFPPSWWMATPVKSPWWRICCDRT